MKIQDQGLDDVLGHLRQRFNSDLTHFTDCIRGAFANVDAVFWRGQYLEFYWQCVTTVPGYVQEVVLANAHAESAGSKGLHALWQSVRGLQEVEDGVERHFRDKSRHSRLFLHLTNLTFPAQFSERDVETEKLKLFDATSASTEKAKRSADLPILLDNLVQMNIGEIRTRAHMFMIGPVLTALAPSRNEEAVDGILSGLVYDEVSHIGYTACLMEEWCRDGHKRLISDLYATRLTDFNKYTIEQTRRSLELYGGGRFPNLFEI